jgi:hypothetical protein
MSLEFVLRSLGLSAAALLVAGADCTVIEADNDVDTLASPDTLTVLDHNDTWARGNGDEVAIGRLLFHATFGDPASTEVIVDDRLHELSNGEMITLPEDLLPVGLLDFGDVPLVDWEDDVNAYDAPVAISGSVAIAIELDLKGTGKARKRIAAAADTLRHALDFFVAGPHGSLSGLPDVEKLIQVAKSFYCVQAVLADIALPSLCPAHPDHPEWSDAGGEPSGGALERRSV